MDAFPPHQSLPDDLTDLIGLLFPSGIALAILCVAAQAGLMIVTLGIYAWTAVAGFLFAHAFFIVMLTDLGMRALDGDVAPYESPFRLGALGGLILLMPILLFWLPTQTNLEPFAVTAGWPWLEIGWVVITGFALPARIVARLRGKRFVALPWWQMLLLMIPCLAIIHLVDFHVERCTGECWGLFEGGMVLIPLLAAPLFTASLSCAVLSALAGRRMARVSYD